MSKAKTRERKPSPAAPQNPAGTESWSLKTVPPLTRHPRLLALSIIALAAWAMFLAWMALRG